MKPVIGISTSYAGVNGGYSNPSRYSRSVFLSGGTPLLIPYFLDTESVEQIISMCDGLLLSGGDDVDPSLYGEERLPCCGETEEGRDIGERMLFDAAMKKNIPVLGICRGIQSMNVFAGGTLFQDIAAQHPGFTYENHHQKAPYSVPLHGIKVEKSSLLYRLTGGKTAFQVNSMHHQAVKTVAPGFIASAISDDGIIEAIEKKDGGFVLGVQWHPEHLYGFTEEAKPIFDGFIKAAAGEKENI